MEGHLPWFATPLCCSENGLQPPFSLKINEKCPGHEDQNPPENKITVLIMQFRQVLEICTINSCDKGEGNKYGGKYGQDLHDIIHSICHHRIVYVKVIG